jgi:omega-amidase
MVADTLHIVLIQPRLIWGSSEHNLRHLDRMINEIPDCDLVVLPEMFETGFMMEEYMGHPMVPVRDSSPLKYLLEWSERRDIVVCGSIAIIENNALYNRFLAVGNGDILAMYDKRHLFNLMDEDKYFTPGNRRITFDVLGWKIQPFICYDLRFPAWCRNTEEADLQLYVANWPAKRAHHWKLLLQARAVENQCYTAGVNVVGTDHMLNDFSGDSTVYEFSGDMLCSLSGQEGWIQAHLSKKKLQAHRNRYPFLPDRDIFAFE